MSNILLHFSQLVSDLEKWYNTTTHTSHDVYFMVRLTLKYLCGELLTSSEFDKLLIEYDNDLTIFNLYDIVKKIHTYIQKL